jgi:hypothetical protein
MLCVARQSYTNSTRSDLIQEQKATGKDPGGCGGDFVTNRGSGTARVGSCQADGYLDAAPPHHPDCPPTNSMTRTQYSSSVPVTGRSLLKKNYQLGAIVQISFDAREGCGEAKTRTRDTLGKSHRLRTWLCVSLGSPGLALGHLQARCICWPCAICTSQFLPRARQGQFHGDHSGWIPDIIVYCVRLSCFR